MESTTGLAVEEKVFSLFQPDTLLAHQYLSTFRRKYPLAPEKRLMFALLQDAVDCFRKHARARNKRKQALFVAAEDWIFNKSSGDWLFSFENVCEVLGLSPRYVRRELSRLRLRKIAPSRKRRLPRGASMPQRDFLS